jgi:transposase-like protein
MLLTKTTQKYEHTTLHQADWFKKNIPEGFTVFAFLEETHCRIRTTNGFKVLSREIYRRTRVGCIFPNQASCLRLISKVLMEKQRSLGDEQYIFDI